MHKLCFLALLGLPVVASASTIFIKIDVVQDGEDILYFQGSTLTWQHLTNFANGNATISATINGVAVPAASLPNNGVWVNGITGQQCGGTLTCPVFAPNTYTLPASLALPALAQTVVLQSLVVTASGTTVAGGTCGAPPCTIVIPTNANNQQPTLANGFTLKVDLNDQPSGGTHAYSIGLTFSDGITTPEPATFVLSAAGLLAVAVAAKRRPRV
jgi:hypothetical protein